MDKPEHHVALDDVEGMEPSLETYTTIMATNKPNPRGPGYIKLYLLAGMIFLCSTMNGQYIQSNQLQGFTSYSLQVSIVR